MNLSWTERIARLMPEPASVRDLRSFGLVVGGVFAIIGVWPLALHALPVRTWALAVAAPLVVAALTVPRALRYPYRVWMFVGHCLGWVNARVLMTLIFFLVFTPIALVMRLMKRDALRRRLDPSASTYRVIVAPRTSSHVSHPF
jgi:hypothetical protein